MIRFCIFFAGRSRYIAWIAKVLFLQPAALSTAQRLSSTGNQWHLTASPLTMLPHLSRSVSNHLCHRLVAVMLWPVFVCLSVHLIIFISPMHGSRKTNKYIGEGLMHDAAWYRGIPDLSSRNSGNKCRLARPLTLPNFCVLRQDVCEIYIRCR